MQIRHQELVKLEKSIMELKTLFVEMALLVEQQVFRPTKLKNNINTRYSVFRLIPNHMQMIISGWYHQ